MQLGEEIISDEHLSDPMTTSESECFLVCSALYSLYTLLL